MARQFLFDNKCLREWLDQLQEEGFGFRKKGSYMKVENLSAELDKAVLNFMLEEQTNGQPVSIKDLCMKALERAKELNLPDSFKAFAMWLKR